MSFKCEPISNEKLGDVLVQVYGNSMCLYDNMVTNAMRSWMTDRGAANQGFGMCDGYLVFHEERPNDLAVLLIWKEDVASHLNAENPMNYFSGKISMSSLSAAANLFVLSNMSFSKNSEHLGTAYHILREFMYEQGFDKLGIDSVSRTNFTRLLD